ncbi:hypothetical protein AX17_006685 [Amanita inopinata Kibby_2008]|nr:hypothetical protein AX17_006685 [Amanita inopinata Kibby_2008]
MPGDILSAIHDHVQQPPPKHLETRDIPGLAKYIKSKPCRNIVFMIGAGVSTAAGIPDFRSPDTGLYANLARLHLPYPEAVFDISYFRENPKPFYTLAHELQPGKFRPTITHSFVRLLLEKGLLRMCFTQNIDTLERKAGIPEDKIVEAHGSFATHHCIDCGLEYDDDKMMEVVEQCKIPRCPKCDGLVKPDIVFFGEPLPAKFFSSLHVLQKADLLIILGTSLTVYPFAMLAQRTNDDCPRVLINLESVSSLGTKPDDVVLLGKCDDTVQELCKELEWHDELLDLWNETRGEPSAAKEPVKPAKDEVEELARAITEQVKLEEEETVKHPEANNEIEEQSDSRTSEAVETQHTRAEQSETDKKEIESETKQDKDTPIDQQGAPIGEREQELKDITPPEGEL